MILPECPHCFAHVIPRPDRTCPNCTKPLDEVNAQGFVALWISPATVLPCNCHRCGVATTRTDEIVGWTRETVAVENQDYVSRYLLFAVMWFVMPFAILLGKKNGQENIDKKHSVTLPTCAGCSASDTAVLDFNQNERALKIAVHRNFAELSTGTKAGLQNTQP